MYNVQCKKYNVSMSRLNPIHHTLYNRHYTTDIVQKEKK